MAEEKDKSQQTEEPTQKRIEEARKKGQVVKSREPSTAIAFLVLGLLLISGAGSFLAGTLKGSMGQFLLGDWHDAFSPDGMQRLFWQISADMALILATLTIPVLLLSLLAMFVISRPVLTFSPLKPKLERIDPIKGFKRMFSTRALVELLKSVLKLILISSVCWATASFYRVQALASTHMDAFTIGRLAFESSVWLVLGGGLFFLFLSAFDVLYQRWEHLKELRMTVKELKDEMKETEGDPHLKSRIRQIQMETARSRMMNDVPTADVVITNPTHIAVALKYEQGSAHAPKVVAKGKGRLAERIKEIAKENNVHIRENKVLARTLFKVVKVGQEIPEHLYEAVAIILAEVYNLKGMVPQR